MNKGIKNSLIIIAIIVFLFVITWFIYDNVKKKPVDANANMNLMDENTGLDNFINTLMENDQENNIDKDNTNIVNNSESSKVNEIIESDDTTESTTSREEKAVELVKKEWGSTDGVYFSSESIDAKGRYIVSVRDKKTTSSIMFYVVDVDKQLVIEQ